MSAAACCWARTSRAWATACTLMVRAGNTRTDSAHNRYHIAPQELVRIQRQARGLGLDIVGFYHSHPDHPAQWSKTDFAEAHWMGCSYVITSVEQGKAVMTNSFLLTGTSEENKAFVDEVVEVKATEAVDDSIGLIDSTKEGNDEDSHPHTVAHLYGRQGDRRGRRVDRWGSAGTAGSGLS